MATTQKIPFHTPEGQKLLEESDTTHQTYLIQIFKKQIGAKTCGTQSVALLLSARYLGQHRGSQNSTPGKSTSVSTAEDVHTDLPFTESNMFSYQETNKVIDKSVQEQQGCTLSELQYLFHAHNYKATEYYSDAVDVNTFRTLASKALTHVDSKCGVIVNYDEADLGQDVNGKGHFSPLAGYNQTNDMFLLLDTWWNTEDVWVKTEFLFEAMCTVDYSGGGKYRGFVILEE